MGSFRGDGGWGQGVQLISLILNHTKRRSLLHAQLEKFSKLTIVGRHFPKIDKPTDLPTRNDISYFFVIKHLRHCCAQQISVRCSQVHIESPNSPLQSDFPPHLII